MDTSGAIDGDSWFTIPPTGAGGRVQVRLTSAVHDSRWMPHRPNAAHGPLVSSEDGVVWVAGDTGLFDGMAEVRLAAGPVDVAVVPVGGWGPRLSAGHLEPDQAAQACALVGARFAVRVRWGTFHLPGGRDVPPGWLDRAGETFSVAPPGAGRLC
ncbi:MAG: MBL fold metallo-hydrolase [Sporichthyaceae bacterium]